MGQKIHPLGLRLGITQKHKSQWFAKTKEYPQLVIEDRFLRQIIHDKFSNAGITDIEIQRKSQLLLKKIKIKIRTARPRIIVGRKGKGLLDLRTELDQKLKSFRSKNDFSRMGNQPKITTEEISFQKKGDSKIGITIHVTKPANPNSEAAFIAEFLVKQLEKRVRFRKALKKAMVQAEKARVEGIKIQISGRLNGAEIARSEWVREGRIPLQTLRADIDYSYQTAKTIYGLLGIKVWIFKGEVLNSNLFK